MWDWIADQFHYHPGRVLGAIAGVAIFFAFFPRFETAIGNFIAAVMVLALAALVVASLVLMFVQRKR